MATAAHSNSLISLKKPTFQLRHFLSSTRLPLDVSLPQTGVSSCVLNGENVCRLKALAAATDLKTNAVVEPVDRKQKNRSPFFVMDNYDSFTYNICQDQSERSADLARAFPFTVGRYHSLVIDKETFPRDELEVRAWTEDGLIMAARHKKYKQLQEVQFHPDSIITTEGISIVHNFVKMIERKSPKMLRIS